MKAKLEALKIELSGLKMYYRDKKFFGHKLTNEEMLKENKLEEEIKKLEIELQPKSNQLKIEFPEEK